MSIKNPVNFKIKEICVDAILH